VGTHASDKEQEQAKNSASAHPGRASMDPSNSNRESLLDGMFHGDESPQSSWARKASTKGLPHLLHAGSGANLMASPSGHDKDKHSHFPDPFAEGGKTSSSGTQLPSGNRSDSVGGTPKGTHGTGGNSSGGTPKGARGASRTSSGEGSEGSHSIASLRARRK
jgi:hypothetical protein